MSRIETEINRLRLTIEGKFDRNRFDCENLALLVS